MAMRFNSASFFVLAVCLTAISLFGQITGDLQVRVADATDAVVPNAGFSSADPAIAKPSVSVAQGSTAFTRVFLGPSSADKLYAIASNPAGRGA